MTDVERLTHDQNAELQQRFGGQFVARRGAEVIANAKSLGELNDLTAAMSVDWSDVVIQYVDRADRVRAY